MPIFSKIFNMYYISRIYYFLCVSYLNYVNDILIIN